MESGTKNGTPKEGSSWKYTGFAVKRMVPAKFCILLKSVGGGGTEKKWYKPLPLNNKWTRPYGLVTWQGSQTSLRDRAFS